MLTMIILTVMVAKLTMIEIIIIIIYYSRGKREKIEIYLQIDIIRSKNYSE